MNKKSKSISFGDKIFARVTRNGVTIYNYVSEKVANMTQLIHELRTEMKDIKGLVMIHIRNYNQGWGEDRPLMLYSEKVINYGVAQPEMQMSKAPVQSQRGMLFPWETH